MSVDEYRKQVRDPAIERDRDDENFRRALEKKGIGPGAKVTDKPERQHIEDDHTEMVAGYLEILMMQGKVVEYTHTANETYTKSPMQKARNTRTGVRSGIPDMVVVFKNAVLFLELKRPDGGVVSKSQKAWMEALRAVGGPVHCEIARGFDSAKIIIDKMACVT
jgi:hypothetical protein